MTETEASTLYTTEESVPIVPSNSVDTGPDTNAQLPDEGASSTLGPNHDGDVRTRLDGTIVSDMDRAREMSSGSEFAQASAGVASQAVTRAQII